MKVIKFFFLLILVLFLIPFAIYNKQVVPINFFPFPYVLEIPIYLLILVLFFIAYVLGYIFSKLKK